MTSLVAPAVLFALLAAPVHAEVIVVDIAGGPGASYTQLQPAIDAAADGDMLLVRSGNYFSFTIDGRTLSIVEDAGASVSVGPWLESISEVRNVPAGGSVVLRGLTFDSWWTSYAFGPLVGSTLVLRDNAGPVWLEDCLVMSGRPSLLVSGCADVTVAGCSLIGFGHESDIGIPSPGCRIEGGAVTIVSSLVIGTDGLDAQMKYGNLIGPTAGGHGLVVHDSSYGARVTLMASTFQGGAGGNGDESFWCPGPAAGGDGVHAAGAVLSSLCHVDCTLLGGAAGLPVDCAPPALPGLGIVADGLVLPLPGATPRLLGVAPVHAGEAIALSLQGTAGDSAFLLVSATQGGALLASKGGDVLVGPPALLIPLGPLPRGGALTVASHAPPTGPGMEEAVAFLQGATCGSDGPCRLGTGTVLVVLSQGL